jgi:cytochrome P450
MIRLALRIHPVVPSNSRFSIRDTILPLGGGPQGKDPLFVPRGTMIGYSPYAMHRRHDIYGPVSSQPQPLHPIPQPQLTPTQDADEYKPARWESLRPGWEYLPFNGGPRICLGQQYALTEASYVTVRLVMEFGQMESRDPGVWEESLTLTCCSANGTQVGLLV